MIWKELTEADVPAAAELNRLARWNQTERDWRGYLEFAPGGCQGVMIEGRLAGTFTTVRYGTVAGWIGMVLVHPDFRRRGLGTALLRRAIHHLRGEQVASIGLDATDMGRAVYLPLGFKDEYVIERMEGTLGPATGSHAAVVPFAEVRFGALGELDETAFGAPREPILRSLAGRQPGLCFADAEGRGYLIAREGREALQIGPWIARDPAVAAALFDRLCAAAPGRRAFVDVPAPNAAAAAWARALGFRLQRALTRMTLDARLPPAREAWIYSTAGAEKG